MVKIKIINGGVCAAAGFEAAGFYCGIKENISRKKDLAFIKSDVMAKAGGVFTTNKFAAAPVEWCREVIKGGEAQAIFANSANANACTGEQGRENVQKTLDLVSHYSRIPKEKLLVCSTGVIGVQLPMSMISGGIPSVIADLSPMPLGSEHAADAIATTDTFIKEYAVEYEFDGKTVHVGGIAKGSGMIHPNMATMLCFITTDLKLSAAAVQQACKTVADDTFNMITVDGDTSTNDTMLLLANGMAGNAEINCGDEGYAEFTEALYEVAKGLAKMMATDGEGATKCLECHVNGAKTKADARKAAKAIIDSSLVKAAFFGEDANWGRIICAAGYSGADFDPAKVDLWLESAGGKIQLMAKGSGLVFDEEQAAAVLKEKEIQILLSFNDGEESAIGWGCDLSYDYVKINADYRS
ncbi:MAG: bifunctional glutamate N-acetyltransferase/amino-acid acetyltransferase ArgJ [Bacillota bacterium]